MLAVLLLAVAFLAGCAALPPHDAQPYAAAVPADPSTRLGRIVQASNPGDPASSGLRLLHDGSGALAARLDLIRAAQRSIAASCRRSDSCTCLRKAAGSLAISALLSSNVSPAG